ncbi:hypothetical protein NDU88_006367 [Pleurodeles waltl]|uniref:Uncharacterized protein n=1 Tax=Pleurodeles waltl TaxID=8319 RepID=A0AAV7RNS5_PLEWA|nr:hypothetical protein NDU88_006367 [Pleurodeles waltl]
MYRYCDVRSVDVSSSCLPRIPKNKTQEIPKPRHSRVVAGFVGRCVSTSSGSCLAGLWSLVRAENLLLGVRQIFLLRLPRLHTKLLLLEVRCFFSLLNPEIRVRSVQWRSNGNMGTRKCVERGARTRQLRESQDAVEETRLQSVKH